MDLLDNCLLKQKTVQADPLQLHLQGHHIQNTRMIVADLYSCIRKQKLGSFPLQMFFNHKKVKRPCYGLMEQNDQAPNEMK